MKPTEQQVREWAKKAGAKFDPHWGIAYNTGTATFERFAELAAAWGAAQAQQPPVEEPELPEAVATYIGESPYGSLVQLQEDIRRQTKLYTSDQMHDHFAAGVRAGMGQSQDALGYAQRLAKSIASKEYPEVTQFEVLGDLMGVLSQIDNMTCGMTRVLQGDQQ